ncbi:MAG: L-lysine 6-transaminase [Ignavibacteria bacterium]|nr:L-lysine 6-transaminase [Ignavibacteria bacterium]
MTNLTETKILTDTLKVNHENGKQKSVSITPENVQTELKKHMLVDGFDITVDIEKSGGAYLYDSKYGKNYLDFFTFVASNPLGMNHPKLNNEKFINEIGKVAVNKPSLSDIYTETQAEFVSTFFKYAVPEDFKYSFFIEGGALAVENALKAAIDWKVRKNFKKGYTEEKGHQIIHFKEAFHGRSGYTMSLTNTDPAKILYFPKFKWPRIDNPKIKFPLNEKNLANVIAAEEKAVTQIMTALAENKDDIAAIIIEPIQGEGGDNHFRKEFFIKLRELCDENEMMLIFDEVQTGIALTGKMWAHMHYVQPDLLAFGKKTQVCGVLSTGRIDEIEENVFRTPSRINSTWGGNMTDMKRFTKILEIISEEHLVENCKVIGEHLQKSISGLAEKYPDKVSNPRGLGLFCAFDAADGKMRDTIRSKAFDNELILLGSGEKSVRFRPPVNIGAEDIDKGIAILDKVINGI